MALKVDTTRRGAGPSRGLAALSYVILLVYGSLYPFSGWVTPPDAFAFLLRGWNGTQVSLGDMGTNVLAYIPLGLLLYRFLRPRARVAVAAAFAIAAAFALSLSMEILQGFLPTRVQSTVDLITNTFGGALGVIAARLHAPTGIAAELLHRARSNWLVRGRLTDVGLFALATWCLSRLMPLVPSLDVGKFRAALAPLFHAIPDPRLVDEWRLLSEALTWAGLALVARSVVRPEKAAFAAIALVAAAILLAQIPIVERHLTPEVLAGCAIGISMAKIVGNVGARTRANLAFFLIFAGFCIAENVASGAGRLSAFNWVPFKPQLGNTLVGIDELLDVVGLAAALAWAARSGSDPRTMRRVGWAAGTLVGAGAFALELNQRYVPGRVGDITTPLIMVLTFILGWRWAALADAIEASPAEATTPSPARPAVTPINRARSQGLRQSIRFYGIALALVIISIWVAAHSPSVNYNVRQLLYPGHPMRSALLLSVALFLTLAVPAWLVAWICRRRLAPYLFPLALSANAFLAWLAVVNSVPSRNLHDIVGAPVLRWPGTTETCLRFLALHSAVTLLVTGGVVLALALFQSRRVGLMLAWIILSTIFGPLLHWAIVTEAATDNLTELMRGGGSLRASLLLSLAAVLSFCSGSLVSAGIAFARRRVLAFGLAAMASIAAYQLFVAGSEPVIIKYGKIFSAMQFLLSPDRAHYVGGYELIIRYIAAYVALVTALALLQYRAWAAMAAGLTTSSAHLRNESL